MVVHCAHLDGEVLIWPNAITGIDNTEQGLLVSYQCACGEPGQVLTGSSTKRDVSAHVAA